jgi:adenosine/AMP kinase
LPVAPVQSKPIAEPDNLHAEHLFVERDRTLQVMNGQHKVVQTVDDKARVLCLKFTHEKYSLPMMRLTACFVVVQHLSRAYVFGKRAL